MLVQMNDGLFVVEVDCAPVRIDRYLLCFFFWKKSRETGNIALALLER